LKNYNVYIANKKQILSYYLCSAAALFLLGLLFYRNFIIALFCCFFSFIFKKKWIDFQKKRCKERLLEGFRDFLYSLSASMAGGKQLPLAMEDAQNQLFLSYGEKSDIYIEIKNMLTLYNEVHSDLEILWQDFAKRSDLSEIKQFATSCRICRQNGGNIEAVCLKCASVLLDKMNMNSEIKAITAEKKFDILLLSIMPILILLFLNVFSYGYIEVLYTSLAGRFLMSLSLFLLIISSFWSFKMMEFSL